MIRPLFSYSLIFAYWLLNDLAFCIHLSTVILFKRLEPFLNDSYNRLTSRLLDYALHFIFVPFSVVLLNVRSHANYSLCGYCALSYLGHFEKSFWFLILQLQLQSNFDIQIICIMCHIGFFLLFQCFLVIRYKFVKHSFPIFILLYRTRTTLH